MKLDNRLMHIALDIDSFIRNSKSQAWTNQVKFPNCFLKLDPKSKQITICRWGFDKRPSRTESMYWVRIDLTLKTSTLQGLIIDSLANWDKHWDEIYFDAIASEAIPNLLPFSRAVVSDFKLPEKFLLANIQ